MRRFVHTIITVGIVLSPTAMLAQSSPPNARTVVIEDAVVRDVQAKIIDGCKQNGWKLLAVQPDYVLCSSSVSLEGQQAPPGTEWASVVHMIPFELSELDGDVTAVAYPTMIMTAMSTDGQVLSTTDEVRVGKVYDETLRILRNLNAE